MKRIKALLFTLLSLTLFACSAQMPTEDVGSTQEALITCSITGSSGSAVWPPATLITGLAIVPFYNGIRLSVTSCHVDGTNCQDDAHIFYNVHWTKVNLDYWTGTIAQPLRRVKVEGPGCQLSAPSMYCMTFYGDYDFGDHIGRLQNATRFLSDKPIALGVIEAPVGYGVSRIVGYGSNVWQMRYANSSGTAMATKNWLFTLDQCP